MGKRRGEGTKRIPTSISLSPEIKQLADLILRAEIRPNISNLFEFLLTKHARENGYIKDFNITENTQS